MNRQLFSGKGDLYKNARPSYPEILFKTLVSRGKINADFSAADIGAGTGIFTRQLSGYVCTVYAVEPEKDMRIKGEDMSYPSIHWVEGTAEHTGLSDNSVELVTAAQAFHWFDREKFKSECRRILVAGGKVLLVWNVRDEESPFICANMEINRKYCPNFSGASAGFDLIHPDFSDFFEGKIETFSFENTCLYDRDTFLNRNLSSSYALYPHEKEYEAYLSALVSLFERYSIEGKVKYPYITRCYLGTV